MIELNVTQNRAEWHRQRAGIPTASAAKHLITPTGKPASGEAVDRYLYELIAQRMQKTPVVSFQSFWMERGLEAEADALKLFQFEKEVEVEPCGFILNDTKTAGASPDGKIVGQKRGLEIKSPKPEIHLMYLDRDGYMWKDHYPQVQFQLMVTKWDAMELYSFHPDLPPAFIPTEPKASYISTLDEITQAFTEKLEKTYARFVDMGLAQAQWRRDVREMPILKSGVPE